MDSLSSVLVKAGIDPEKATEIGAELEKMYAEPGRYYHTLSHILAVVREIEEIGIALENPATVLLATCFHDAIYDTRAKDNEEQSADYAVKVLQEAEVNPVIIENVKRLVLATKTHSAPEGDHDCQLLLDADLSILGQPAGVYREYARQIRQEYGWVPEEQYCAGRRQVLAKFLERPRLYFTTSMFDRYEAQARRNLAAEIAELDQA